jgi:LacI family transcriptional regulator
MPPGLPAVTVLQCDHQGRIPAITVDERAGIGALVQHLAALGHRRIAYLSSEKVPTRFGGPPLRLPAYRDAMRACGLKVDSRWVRALRESAYERQRPFVELGREKMEMWLQDNWRSLGCTALLAQNDETAIGAMQALSDAGIDVPGQVSVCGFDGIDAGALVRPQLTTVLVPLHAVGEAAFEALMTRITQTAGQARDVASALHPELVVRASSGRAPHSR